MTGWTQYLLFLHSLPHAVRHLRLFVRTAMVPVNSTKFNLFGTRGMVGKQQLKKQRIMRVTSLCEMIIWNSFKIKNGKGKMIIWKAFKNKMGDVPKRAGGKTLMEMGLL